MDVNNYEYCHTSHIRSSAIYYKIRKIFIKINMASHTFFTSTYFPNFHLAIRQFSPELETFAMYLWLVLINYDKSMLIIHKKWRKLRKKPFLNVCFQCDENPESLISSFKFESSKYNYNFQSLLNIFINLKKYSSIILNCIIFYRHSFT